MKELSSRYFKSKDCKNCFANLRGFILDRIVFMGLDASRFLKGQREIEEYLKEIQSKVDKSKKTKKGGKA